MQLYRHCTAALAAAGALVLAGGLGPGATLLAQTPAPGPVPGETTFAVFIRGVDSGREQVGLTRSGTQWVITSTGRIGEMTLNRFELKYSADWQPAEMRLEATLGVKDVKKLQILTSFGVTSAINEISQNGVTNSKTDQITARTVVLPNHAFAGYEALAARLAGSAIGAEIPTYVPPSGEVKVVVKTVTNEDVQTPSGIIKSRKYELNVLNVGSTFPMIVIIDEKSRLARLEIPSNGLLIVRNDLMGVAVRTLTARNPTDADVTIPANGFNIAGTITTPAAMGKLRHPTVILVSGAGNVDRESTVAGVPILSQLAGGLAARGFLVLRYDKRGVGQSGGRHESATQRDYADDLIGIVRWLEKRDDVDSKRIAIVGHSEGGTIGMQAAAREKRIDALVLVATAGTTGAELMLEQQRNELDRMKLPDADKAEKIELQKQIQAAVVSGNGWDALPPDVRKQADSPWFRSLLLFDPAEAMPRIKQPILIVQGALDKQILPYHADKLAELARARKKDAGPVEVVQLGGLNHLLVPATTGEVQEYAQLTDKTISPEVARTIGEWLKSR